MGIVVDPFDLKISYLKRRKILLPYFNNLISRCSLDKKLKSSQNNKLSTLFVTCNIAATSKNLKTHQLLKEIIQLTVFFLIFFCNI